MHLNFSKKKELIIAIIFAQIFQLSNMEIVVRDGIKPNVSGHDVSSEEMLYDAVLVWVSWENLEEEKIHTT